MLLSICIDLFIDNLELRNMSKETIIGYNGGLRDFMGFIEFYYNSPLYIDEINLFDLELYVRYKINRGSEPISINRSIYILRSFYNFLEKRSIINKNISKLLESISIQEKERISLDKEEVEEFINNIEHDLVKTAVLTLANTGLRISELVSLRLEDVDLDKNIINVINGKGGKNRKIPINKDLKKALIYYLNNIRESSSDNFFATKQSGGLSPQYVNKIMKDTCFKLGWEKHITAHILRHSFASNLIREGVSVAVVQKLLGHADLRVTSRYIHQNLGDLERAVEQL